ncbi:MAG: DUF21 domain-containing protein [Elusimicrobia bacterium]|nr:DUF21 domain-containing protein [Elusimicrobiota bacterium]
MDYFYQLLISFGFLLLNAFFVLAEFAIVKVRTTRLDEIAKQGDARAKLARSIVRKLDAYLSAIQLGITMSSLGLGWIGEPAVAHLLHPWIQAIPAPWKRGMSYSVSFGIAFVLITAIHVIIGELAPKSVAIRTPERTALLVARPLYLFYRLFYLPMTILNWCSNNLLKLIGFHSNESELAHSEEELRMILSYSQEQGKIPLHRLLLFENLFDFRYTTVQDILTPLESIAYWDAERSWEENWAAVKVRKLTRYPLCQGDIHHPLGWVHFKDIGLLLTTDPPRPPDLNSIKRQLLYIPKHYSLQQALTEFQKHRTHMALVQDKNKKTVGLITLEDVLEELVGEIRDEFESPTLTGLSDITVEEALLLNLTAKDKSEAIRMLLDLLHTARPQFDIRQAWDIIWKREKGLTSAVGRGVAFPHARLPSLEKPLLSIGRIPQGLEFQAPDNAPVHFIFLILTPAREPVFQLRILARLAAMASNQPLLKKLLHAKTKEEIMEAVRAFDLSATD